MIAVFIVLKFVHIEYGIYIGVNIGVCLIGALVINFNNSLPHTLHHYFFACFFGYLWAHHFHYSHEP